MVQRYVIFDDGSTDGTLEVLKDRPRVDLRRFERTHADSFVASHQKMQNRAWKESRKEADWIVVTAIDEHLHVPRVPMRDYLERCQRKGVLKLPRRDELLLLHYKNLGFERVFERHRTLKSGLGSTDTAQRWAG